MKLIVLSALALVTLVGLASISAGAQINPSALSAATIGRFERVPEFAYIRELARQYGIKVYLFGGTAAAFGHYVRWDLEREAGDDKYQPERFDYDFTNIYRGNQDLDIVIDADAATAQKFAAELQANFPHFQGDKDAWEVRLLRQSIGEKSALRDNYDFLNQHTDSNSTGLIDVTQLNPSQQTYFDLRDWENPNSKFLNDVASGSITYYYSSTHKTTSRYRAGMNPPILSAVRYLAKLTQYDVIGSPEDLQKVMVIVIATNLATLSSYAQEKVKEFSLKALLNSPDVEYAWNLLDDVGLRQKLIEWDKAQINTEGSLAWWMNKEPLRSFELGQGDGKTAQELGIDVVSHTTKNFQAYENITRSTQGRVNVFISRTGSNIAGEESALGHNGLYTAVGAIGGRDSGLTIRFHMHPKARTGSDFVLTNEGSIAIALNKNAIRLIQENISLTLPQYLAVLLTGKIGANDKGLIARIDRRLSRLTPSDKDLNESAGELQNLTTIDIQTAKLITEHILSKPWWAKRPDVILKLVQENNVRLNVLIVKYVLSQPWWVNDPKKTLPIVSTLIEQNRSYRSTPEFENGPPVGLLKLEIGDCILSNHHWTQYPELIDDLMSDGDSGSVSVAEWVLPHTCWANMPQYARWGQLLVDQMPEALKRGSRLLSAFSKGILNTPASAQHPEWVVDIATQFLEEWWSGGEHGYVGHFWDSIGRDYFKRALKEPWWQKNPVFRAYLEGEEVTTQNIIKKNKVVPFNEWFNNYKVAHEITHDFSCGELLAVGATR